MAFIKWHMCSRIGKQDNYDNENTVCDTCNEACIVDDVVCMDYSVSSCTTIYATSPWDT